MARHALTHAPQRACQLMGLEILLVLFFVADVLLEIFALAPKAFFGVATPPAVVDDKGRKVRTCVGVCACMRSCMRLVMPMERLGGRVMAVEASDAVYSLINCRPCMSSTHAPDEPKPLPQVALEAKLWGQFRLVLVGLFLLDVCRGLYTEGHSVRWSRPLRPLYVTCLFDTLRRWSRLVALLMGKLRDVLGASAIVLGLFSLLGLVLFSETGYYGAGGPMAPLPFQNFDNFLNSAVAMYVLITTQNFGELMIPAYLGDRSAGTAVYFFFFAAFVVAVVLFLTHLGLPRTYDTFVAFQRDQAYKSRLLERLALLMSFKCLDHHNRGCVGHSGHVHMLNPPCFAQHGSPSVLSSPPS
jgi:hypothetical protein